MMPKIWILFRNDDDVSRRVVSFGIRFPRFCDTVLLLVMARAVSLLFLATTSINGLVQPPNRAATRLSTSNHPTMALKGHRNMASKDAVVVNLKGGALPEALTKCLASGALGVPALSGVASAVVLPLTLIREGYSFSVGYGASVAVMGGVLLAAFGTPKCAFTDPSAALGWAATAYGARLAIYLFFRQMTVPSINERIKAFDKTPRLKRAPLAISVAIFYACMTCPVLYALRSPSSSKVAKMGAVIAWAGVVIEAVTDAQKYVAKKKIAFGPTGGLFALSRHANYFGELVFWYGLLIGGLPSFGRTSLTPWVCSSLGIVGITFIMLGATKRLEKKQSEAYSGMEEYEAWVAGSNALFPKLF